MTWEEKEGYMPFFTKFVIPANDVCRTRISLDLVDGPFGSQPDNNLKKGFWGTTEWMDNVSIMMTKLKSDEVWDTENSALFSKETYFYNREHDDGDVTGRVPVTKDSNWELLMINYDATKESSIKIEYGGAVQAIMASTGAIAAALALVFAF